MNSTLNVVLECPYCHKPTGYHFTREGVIYNQEVIGRFAGNTIPCVHCKGKIVLMIQFRYAKRIREQSI